MNVTSTMEVVSKPVTTKMVTITVAVIKDTPSVTITTTALVYMCACTTLFNKSIL